MDKSAGYGLHTRFLRGLALAPEGVAVRTGEEALTYRELHGRALAWGGELAAVGARAVGVLAGKGPVAYPALLATLYAGAAVVPLRPDFPAARTRQILRASGAGVVIADRASLKVLADVLDGTDDLAVLVPDAEDGDEIPGRPVRPDAGRALTAPAEVKPGDTAYLLFTSGSTGVPKGVVLTHGGFEHYFRLVDERYGLGPADVVSQAFDLNFDCAVFDVFAAWGAGATSVPVPAHAYRDLPAFIAGQGLTVWFSTPSVIDLVRRTGSLGAGRMPALRWSLFAGEALKTRDAADWQAAAPGSALENLYGPTELTVTITVHRWAGEHSEAASVNGLVPIGAVHPGHHHLLLGEDGEPTSEEGELCVSGPQLAAGYVDPRNETGAFFERQGRRYYRTGDRVRRLDGEELIYLGRRDAQVQVQGWRVELAEVEHALRDCGVADAVAVAVTGASGTELFAFYTGAEVPTVELVRRLRGLLPAAVLPKHFHRLAEFPLNTNRKVDRLRLAARADELLQAR
ncbi:amino acid adenylation domain-containing protein [Streptomyces sp. SAI-170]|uniref:AMP-binding protein n=1 Tax=Streptomyces sp. SAI-170 TaxID=3377729 RepID=UPI003C7E45B4